MSSSRTDEELLDRVREGDMRAFGVLWERHAGPALSVARGFVGLDADDIVSEAFERLLVSLQKGNGPRGAFRPYLITTVRNVGRTLYKRDVPRRDADFDLMIDGDAVDGEQAAIREQHRQAAEEAFRSLPARWQEALWYSEVDGLPPREMTAPLGLSSNAISALVVRAKRGFRDAWVTAQLARADSADCRAVIADIGAYTRDGLAPRATRKVEAHVATCAACTAALKEARGIAQTLAIAILPAVAGTVGAAGYLSTLRPPSMPEMQLPVTTAAASETGIEQEDAPSSRRRRGVALAALLLLLVGGVITVAALASPSSVSMRQLGAGEHEASPVAPPAAPIPTPTPTLTPTPAPSPFVETDPPARRDGDGPRRQPLPVLVPSAPVLPAAPPPPLENVTPPVVEAEVSQADDRMYPRVSGESAAPGALIQVMDPDGEIVATTMADILGRWSVAIVGGAVGPSSVSVTQTVRDITSAPSSELAYTVTAPPTATRPLGGDIVNAERFNFRLSAPAGSVIQRSIVGRTPVQTLTVPADGVWNEYLALPPGDHVLRLRWADPVTRDYGPWTEVAFSAE
ncbi:sigma-70 family RNA polymerase sigma factor [Microbacterium sp. NPDC087665]|uniref:sigma-70 family RNA polymerase sigma factor n=1 Tax=Microbacterium sp. NPDC087665 TaxID=3364194 RepID=UPI00380A353B